MEKNIEKVNDTRKKITFSFTADEVSQEKEKTVSEFLKEARIPGFRQGHAPRNMIEKLYANGIKSQTERALTSKAVDSMNSDKSMDIYAVVDVKSSDKDGALEMTFTADVYPDVKLPENLSEKVELPSEEVDEKEIDSAVEYHRNQRAKYEVVDREIKKGDFVRLNYSGSIDGAKISEIAKDLAMFGDQKGTWEEAGNAEAPGVQGVVQGIVGMKKGDKATLKHEFPKEFPNAGLAGKNADYEVEILEVREKILPEIDEEFLKSFEVKTPEELRSKIKESIAQEKKQNNEIFKRQKAVEQLMAKCDFPIPESALNDEKQAVLEDMMARFISSGAKREDIEKHKEELFETAEKEAEGRAKMRILLNRIAKANDVKIDNEDMSRVLWQEAMRTRTKPEELIRQLRKDPERQNRMRRDALLQKAINFIAEKAEVSIKK